MSTKNKVLAAVLFVFFVLFTTISTVLAGLNNSAPEEQIFPTSGLTNSIFESQNNTYVANESFPATHQFENIPYTIDVPQVPAAGVDLGNVYQVSDKIYLYITEYNPLEKYLQNAITAELGKALMMGYNNDLTQMRSAVEEDGYINGFSASYKIFDLTVTDAVDTVPSTIIGYELTPPEADSEQLFVSVVSKTSIGEISNSEMANMKDLLDSMVATIQYSEELKGQIDSEKEKEAAEAEAAAAEAASDLGDSSYNYESTSGASESGEVKSMSLTIDKDYESLVLYLYWENSTTKPDALKILNTDKTVSYDPTSIENGQAVFRLGKIKAGTMLMEITGSNYGKCTMALYEESEDPANKTSIAEQTPSTYGGYEGSESSGNSSSSGASSQPTAGSVTVNPDGSITYGSGSSYSGSPAESDPVDGFSSGVVN